VCRLSPGEEATGAREGSVAAAKVAPTLRKGAPPREDNDAGEQEGRDGGVEGVAPSACEGAAQREGDEQEADGCHYDGRAHEGMVPELGLQL
jgi:hypothetical protein